jgi:PAS domain S-box-containing protein
MYDVAMLTGEWKLFEQANRKNVDARESLSNISELTGLDTDEKTESLNILNRIIRFTDNANPVYTQMTINPDYQKVDKDTVALAQQTKTIQKKLQYLSGKLTDENKNELISVSTDTRYYQYVNILTFVAAVITTLILISFIIARLIIPQLNNLSMLKKAIQQTSESIAITDSNGNCIFVNDSWYRMHGYDQEDLTGKNISLFHVKKHAKENEPGKSSQIALINERGIASAGKHIKKNGETFPVLITQTPCALGKQKHGLIVIARHAADQETCGEKNG